MEMGCVHGAGPMLCLEDLWLPFVCCFLGRVCRVSGAAGAGHPSGEGKVTVGEWATGSVPGVSGALLYPAHTKLKL